LIADEGVALDGDRLIGCLIMMNDVGDQLENELSSGLQRFSVVVLLEPFLALQDGYIGVSLDFNKVVVFSDDVESLSMIGEAAAIGE
jgi:hypothetical protein